MLRHSLGCREVISLCGFDEKQYRLIEPVVYWLDPKRIASVVRRTDPRGEHDDFGWFVKPVMSMFGDLVHELTMDDAFWPTYDQIASWLELDFYPGDLELIAIMSQDERRISYSMGKSRKNIRYLYKVWDGAKPTERTLNEVFFKLEQHEVKTDAVP
jgi:hypothetical protein